MSTGSLSSPKRDRRLYFWATEINHAFSHDRLTLVKHVRFCRVIQERARRAIQPNAIVHVPLAAIHLTSWQVQDSGASDDRADEGPGSSSGIPLPVGYRDRQLRVGALQEPEPLVLGDGVRCIHRMIRHMYCNIPRSWGHR